MTIPSKSIMKLSGEEIGKHPIFAAFLDALSPKDGVESPSSASLVEETDSETDLQGILEKQIEEISKLVDGSLEFSADLLEAKRGIYPLLGTLYLINLKITRIVKIVKMDRTSAME